MVYKFLSHTADVKFEARGGSLEEVFVSSADALFESIYGDVKIKGSVEKKIRIEAEDNISLLYSFLEEFLFLLDAKNFVVAKVKDVTIDRFVLTAVVVGDDVSGYEFTNEVKAITYSDMVVEKKNNGKWVAVGVFDV